jgi:hypothetical protein
MNVKLSRFPVSVLGAMASGTITISHKPVYTVVANHVLLQNVEKCYADFFAVFGKKAFSGMGEPVAEADIYRDEPFRAIKSILKGFGKVTGYVARQEAFDLLSIIDQLGGDFENLSYGDEDEKMDKLITEYDKSENQEKLARLNLTDLYITLKTRHTGFKALYFQQNDSNAALHSMSSATSLRKELAVALRNYLGLVTAMKQVDGWKELYAELNELGKSLNKSVSDGEKSEATPQA